MRVFIALPISEDIRRSLAATQEKLRRVRSRVGWVRPANIHLTLAFLGDIPSVRVPEIAGGLERIAAETAPFPLDVAGVGWFGGRRPKVVWVGTGGPGAEALARLRSRIAAMLAEAGFALEDREFHPHLTLGRVRSAGGADELARELGELRETRFGSTEIRCVLLMRSDLRAEGPVYSVLRESPLATSPHAP